jgi:hypothetical protein
LIRNQVADVSAENERLGVAPKVRPSASHRKLPRSPALVTTFAHGYRLTCSGFHDPRDIVIAKTQMLSNERARD